MNSDNEFLNPGKKMPYQIPDGFFSKITGETLQMARLREKTVRRRIVILRTLAVAASIIALVVSGFLFITSVPEKQSAPVVQKIEVEPRQDKIVQDDLPVLVPDVRELDSSAETSEDSESTFPEEEKMEDLLASLSDDELLEWAMALKTDFFINESENDIP